MFNEAPTATIVRSDDLGRTWSWPDEPMFTDHTFTTVMFLDLGQANGGSEQVYAYGIDGNWRTSFSKIVADPTELFLGRVRRSRRRTSLRGSSSPGATQTVGRSGPATSTRRSRYWSTSAATTRPRHSGWMPTTSPGSRRAAWSGTRPSGATSTRPGASTRSSSTEAPAPWGPWRLLHTHDFGHFPWHGPRSPLAKHGGYAPTMPSKFISADGRDLWLQSNWFVPASSRGGRAYSFGLRKVRFDPGTDAVQPATGNLALDGASPGLASAGRAGGRAQRRQSRAR